MSVANFKIKKKCEECGKLFMAKTLMSNYCCHNCSSRASKRKKMERIRNEKFKAIVDGIDKSRSFISIKEAAATFGVECHTLYKYIKE